MADKCLSIITNFGCHFKCPYCVVKNNHIDVPPTTIKGLRFLKSAAQYEKANIISVSGGGDPLHNYPEHKKYYQRLFRLCREMKLPLEMHTSYLDSEFPYEKCKRVVYHLIDPFDILRIKRHGNEIVRVVFVVTENYTPEHIDMIAKTVADSDQVDELSFRQMIDKGYRPTNYCQDYLRDGHQKRWWYIEQNDYNPYYVNGTIHYKFAEISA